MKTTTVTIEWRDFERLAKLTKAASTDDARPVIAAVYLEGDGQEITATATDSYKMANTRLTALQLDGEKTWNALIPAGFLAKSATASRTLLRAQKVKLPAVPDVTIVIDPPDVTLTIRRLDRAVASFTSRLVEGNFPHYRALLVKPSEPLPASKFARKNKDEIETYLRLQGVWVDSEELTRPQLLEHVDKVYNTPLEDRSVAFNSRLLNDLIGSAHFEPNYQPVKVEMFGPSKPIWVSVPSDKEWVGILMPVRV